MAFGGKSSGFGNKSNSGFGKKSSGGFGSKDKESTEFGKKSSSGFGSKSSGGFGLKDKESTGFGSSKSSGFGSKSSSSGFGSKDKESTGFSKKGGFGGGKSSGFGGSGKVEFKSFSPLGSTNKAKEIKAKLGDIDQDMKGIMVKLIGDHRDRKSSEDIAGHFAGVPVDTVKLDIIYDETIQMCPSFSITAKSGGFSGSGAEFKNSGLFIGGKKTSAADKYNITAIGNKFKEVIKCFLDIEKLLDEEEGPLKLDYNNTTISIIDKTIILTPSSLLLNSLKNDLFKVSMATSK